MGGSTRGENGRPHAWKKSESAQQLQAAELTGPAIRITHYLPMQLLQVVTHFFILIVEATLFGFHIPHSPKHHD